MLEKIDLTLSLSKEEYKARMDELGERLTLLQRATWGGGIPVIVVFEGWDASGKGTTINLLAQYLDPRGFRIHPIKAQTEFEMQMPWLWRFWLTIPNYGEITVFDRSWYGRVMVERVEKMIPEQVWRDAYQDINEFEHTLAEDGTVVVKFFLHISKKEQKKRFERLEEDKLQKWRVQKEDWKHHKKYDDYLLAAEEMLARTETEWAPWSIIEATDRRWARVKVLDKVCARLEEGLTKKGIEIPVVVKDEQKQAEEN